MQMHMQRNRYSMQIERDICRCRGAEAYGEGQRHMQRNRGRCRGAEAEAKAQNKSRDMYRAEFENTQSRV